MFKIEKTYIFFDIKYLYGIGLSDENTELVILI